MTDTEKWKALAAPFAPNDIEWRVQQSGMSGEKPWAMVLAYVQNRAIQQRLDEIFDPENWRNEYSRAPEGGVMCGLSLRVGTEWITKWDGAENTEVEAVKGGLSNSMKRAAVQWGIGRYLYKLEATFAAVSKDKGQHYIDIKDKRTKESLFKGYWNDPRLPKWALPEDAKSQPATPPKSPVAKTKEVMGGGEEVSVDGPDDAPTQAQLDRIRQLRKDMGYSEVSTETKIKLLKTKGQAGASIAKLKEEFAIDQAAEAN